MEWLSKIGLMLFIMGSHGMWAGNEAQQLVGLIMSVAGSLMFTYKNGKEEADK